MKFLSFIAVALVLAAEITAITAIEGEMTPAERARLHAKYRVCREAKEPVLAVGAAINAMEVEVAKL
jgi:hypothetical protein